MSLRLSQKCRIASDSPVGFKTRVLNFYLFTFIDIVLSFVGLELSMKSYPTAHAEISYTVYFLYL